MTTTWGHIQTILQRTMNAGHYKVWISPLSATIEGTTLRLEAPNDFVANSVRGRLADSIEDAARSVLGSSAKVIIEAAVGRASSIPSSPSSSQSQPRIVQNTLLPVAECAPVRPSTRPSRKQGAQISKQRSSFDGQAAPSIIVEQSEARKPVAPALITGSERAVQKSPAINRTEQIALPLDWAPASQQQNWRFSFDEFVVGNNNELAFAAARGMCRDAAAVDTLFLNASTGLGKTHLLHAVGHSLCKASNRVNPRIEYLTAEEFASRMVLAMRGYEMERFKARYRDVDVLLLEDVHFLQGKEKMQGEVLATIKSLQERGSRVVFSSTFAPRELRDVDSQLVSRFGSGFLAGIERPDFDTRRRIVESKARIHQVKLPDVVTDLMAERIDDDVRQIESCLRNLILKAQVLNQHISLDMALDIIGNYASASSSFDIEAILRMVCEGFGLSVDQLNSRSRKREYVVARNAAYLLARKHTDLSLKEIGDKFNRRHSTVLKGITALEREITRETPLGRQVASTLSMLERNSRVSM